MTTALKLVMSCLLTVVKSRSQKWVSSCQCKLSVPRFLFSISNSFTVVLCGKNWCFYWLFFPEWWSRNSKVSITHTLHILSQLSFLDGFFFWATKSLLIMGDARLPWGDRDNILSFHPENKGYKVESFSSCIFALVISSPPPTGTPTPTHRPPQESVRFFFPLLLLQVAFGVFSCS